MTAIPIQDVQVLIDRHTAYGIDRHSRDALAEMKTDEFGKHLLDKASTEELIKRYADVRYEELHDIPPRMQKQRDRIVRTDDTEIAIRYDKTDILAMLEHKYVQKKLAAVFQDMTTQIAGVYIPTVIANDHPYQTPKPKQGSFWI